MVFGNFAHKHSSVARRAPEPESVYEPGAFSPMPQRCRPETGRGRGGNAADGSRHRLLNVGNGPLTGPSWDWSAPQNIGEIWLFRDSFKTCRPLAKAVCCGSSGWRHPAPPLGLENARLAKGRPPRAHELSHKIRRLLLWTIPFIVSRQRPNTAKKPGGPFLHF